MLLHDPKKIAGMIVSKIGQPDKSEGPVADNSVAIKAAASKFLSAVKSDNPEMLAEAFSELDILLDEQEGEEEGEY